MAVTKLPAMVIKAAKGAFFQRIAQIPQVWKNHALNVPSETNKETYTFPGFLPVPRVFEDARSIQGFRDFQFDITNKTYELTMLIDLEDFEDDQTGGIKRRFLELADVFGTFKDQLLAGLLENGATDAPPINSAENFTWATFYEAGDVGVVGDSSGMSNDLTFDALATADPTAQEVQSALKVGDDAMMKFEDDKGRPIFNSVAMNQRRAIVPVEHGIRFAEAMNSSFVVGDDTAGGSRENTPWKGYANFDVLPYLANSDTFYYNYLGGVRKPFIFQNRIPLQIVEDTTPEGMQERNGVLVMCRERFDLAYGEPRHSSRIVLT